MPPEDPRPSATTAGADVPPPRPDPPGTTPGRPVVVQFTGPRQVDVVAATPARMGDAEVRVRTLYSGISAGTELTAYRGSNVYLSRTWDPATRLFTDGGATFDYPVVGWGYSEVGEILEVGADVPDVLAPGMLVHGTWGHCSEAVLPWDAVAWRRLPAGVDPIVGVFSRVGAIALNAVLAADLHLGETVAVFGQGVIGLLATRLAVLSGARVVAVDGVDRRLDLARELGAAHVVDFRAGPTAEQVKQVAGGDGIDVAIEISGSHEALREAIRVAPPDGRVVAAGFYQGGANGLRLGDEFHHNRVRLVASQIGGLPPRLRDRWDVPRLHRVVDGLVASGRIDVSRLVSHVVPVAEAADAYRLLDTGAPEVLQVVLDFGVATAADARDSGPGVPTAAAAATSADDDANEELP